MIKLKLQDVVEALELMNKETIYALGLETGEIHLFSEYYDNFDPQWPAYKKNLENFIELPSQDDINVYKIMVVFSESLENETHKNKMLQSLQGAEAFRRFKDEAINLGILDRWNQFKVLRLTEIAKEWCIENNIDYGNM